MENLQPGPDVHKENARPTKTADDAVQWMRDISKRGEYPVSTVSDCCSALTSLMEVVVPEEPSDVQWLLDNVETLARRWATKNSNATTAKTYKSRTKRILTEYVRFLENPMGFVPTPTGRSRKKRNGKSNGTAAKAPDEPLDLVHRVRLPIHGGGVMKCEWTGDFTTKDVERFAYLLRGFASDFGLASSDET